MPLLGVVTLPGLFPLPMCSKVFYCFTGIQILLNLTYGFENEVEGNLSKGLSITLHSIVFLIC